MTDPTLTFSINDKTVFTCAQLLALAPYRWRTPLWPSPSKTKPVFTCAQLLALTPYRWRNLLCTCAQLLLLAQYRWRSQLWLSPSFFNCAPLLVLAPNRWRTPLWPSPLMTKLFSPVLKLLALVPYRWRTPLWPSPLMTKLFSTCAQLLALVPYRWRTPLWPSPSQTKLFSPVLSYWCWHHLDDGVHFDLLHHRQNCFTCAQLLALVPYRWRTPLWPSPSQTKLFSPVLSYWCWHHLDDGAHFDLLHHRQNCFTCAQLLAFAPYRWRNPLWPSPSQTNKTVSPVFSYWRWHHVDDGPNFDLLQQHHRPSVLHSSWAESHSFAYHLSLYCTFKKK